MKYMIMTFGSAEAGLAAMGKDWMLEMVKFMQQLDQDLRDSGELVDAQGLADGSQAKTVRIKNGIPVATDGPYAESKESLVGYWIVDVESEARVIEIASRIVDYVKAPIEVRQVMDAPPDFLSDQPRIEDLLRELAPQVLGALVRRHGQFDACEDAVQEALLAAALQWADRGVPDNPRSWLITVASRRLVDEWRSESARRRRRNPPPCLSFRTGSRQ